MQAWDLLCLQEAPEDFEAPGHLVVRRKCCWRACVVVLHRRWASSLISASDEEAFPTVRIRWGEMVIVVISCYLPHNRSLRGAWSQEFAKLQKQVEKEKAMTQGGHIMIGGDFNQDKLGASAMGVAPSHPARSEEGELGEVEACLTLLESYDMALAAPARGFQPILHGARESLGRCLDYWAISRSLRPLW